MDSERRHELETNDLREFLDNFKDFWDKNGNFLLIGLIVVLGGWLGYDRYNKWQADKAESAYTELNGADSADAFRSLAGEHSKVHDEAMRRGADTALGDARTAAITGEDDEMKSSLGKAADAYLALADRGATTEYQLVGQEGLAKVALMREEWDKAASHYDKVIELAGETYLNQADRAQRALDRLDLLKDPVAFAEPEVSVPELSTEIENALTPQPDRKPALPLPAPAE